MFKQEEYVGQISSIVTVDKSGNPILVAAPNPGVNSFDLRLNVQFFNIIPNINYHYQLEVATAADLRGEPYVTNDQKITDVKLRAVAGEFELTLEPGELDNSAKVSENGYTFQTVLAIDDIPIQKDHPRTLKVIITFGELADGQPVDWRAFNTFNDFSTFISLPENAFREGLPMPRNNTFAKKESTDSND
ncbi:hypothetical protein FO436_08695 [Weissella cibaria]|uniref:hypothetical protein n=1 Tax=Weissella cibaria TaxID=137591 RepID=UPI00118FD354|nr:hypothetical protein [Weissella cibaria]TVV34648.1 hypothetical protein FO436_08695 [Weissella cibaria]